VQAKNKAFSGWFVSLVPVKIGFFLWTNINNNDWGKFHNRKPGKDIDY
jgi:hypothetical protein